MQTVSIIIPNYNSGEMLRQCIDSILKQYTNNIIEIIVVDNGSSDDSIKHVINLPIVKVFKLRKNYGYAAACNVGAYLAKGEILVFLNNDTIVTKNWLQYLIEDLKDPKTGAVQPLLVHPSGLIDGAGDFIDKYGNAFPRRGIARRHFNKKEEVPSARGACLVTKKDLFIKYGGFDSSYFAGYEDVDYCWRLRHHGYKVIYDPRSLIFHLGGITASKIEWLNGIAEANCIIMSIKYADISLHLFINIFMRIAVNLLLYVISRKKTTLLTFIRCLMKRTINLKHYIKIRYAHRRTKSRTDVLINSNIFILAILGNILWHLFYKKKYKNLPKHFFISLYITNCIFKIF